MNKILSYDKYNIDQNIDNAYFALTIFVTRNFILIPLYKIYEYTMKTRNIYLFIYIIIVIYHKLRFRKFNAVMVKRVRIMFGERNIY